MGSDHFADHDTGEGFEDQTEEDVTSKFKADQKEAEAAFAAMFGMAIKAVGTALCVKHQVPDLEPEEVEMVTQSISTLAALYAPTMTEKQAAWFALMGVTVIVVGPRWSIVKAREASTIDAKSEPVPETDPDGDS